MSDVDGIPVAWGMTWEQSIPENWLWFAQENPGARLEIIESSCEPVVARVETDGGPMAPHVVTDYHILKNERGDGWLIAFGSPVRRVTRIQ